MNSAIERLEENVWAACVTQRAAPNLEARERWQRDELAHLKERFVIAPLPAELEPLLEQAVAEWAGREARVCSRLGISTEEFFAQFEATRTAFLQGEDSWKERVAAWYPTIAGAVRNLDWVNLFAWILPRADPIRTLDHGRRGRMVAGVFYAELLYKHMVGPAGVSDSEALRRVEARWQMTTRHG